jgi:hypothetical protein
VRNMLATKDPNIKSTSRVLFDASRCDCCPRNHLLAQLNERNGIDLLCQRCMKTFLVVVALGAGLAVSHGWI